MADPDPRLEHLQRLQRWRVWPTRDVSMQFLREQFRTEIERPHKQLASLVETWQSLVPAALLPHTRLVSLQRGVLRVVVDLSSRLYELDRLLREGLQRELITQHKGPAFRRVQLLVGDFLSDLDERRVVASDTEAEADAKDPDPKRP